MKRPIPEGVRPPSHGETILGYGGDFEMPPEGDSLYYKAGPHAEWGGPIYIRPGFLSSTALYAAHWNSRVNHLNAESLETYLGLEPGSFGKFMKEKEAREIEVTEAHFRRLRTKINESDAGSEVARLNQEPLLAKFVRTANEGVMPSTATEDLEQEDPPTTNPTQISSSVVDALIAKWRRLSADSAFPQNYKNALESCADELEAVLKET